MLTSLKWQVRFLSVVVIVFVLDRVWPYIANVNAVVIMASAAAFAVVIMLNLGDALGFVQTRWLHIQTRPTRSKS